VGLRLRLLAVHAHPDDESSKGAATMARYVDEGAEVLVVSCTGGERGDVLNPRMRDDPRLAGGIAPLRRAEMAEAVRVLGVQHEWLGFLDSGLPEGDPLPPLPPGCFALTPLAEATAPLVTLVRSFRPHVITTYDENGGYPHPDHVMCHRVSMEAFEAAGDPERYPGTGTPWAPAKLYYDRGFTRSRMRALHDAIVASGRPSPFNEWVARIEEWPEMSITTRVDCGEYFDVREQALRAHATQIDPEGPFFALSAVEQARIWPTEEWYLARTRVPTQVPEDDLFAGLRGGSADGVDCAEYDGRLRPDIPVGE